MAEFKVNIPHQQRVEGTFEAIVEAFAGISIDVDSAGALYCKECGIELNWDHNQRAADEKIVADPEASAEAKRNAQARLDAMKNLAYTTKAGRFTFAYSGYNADGPGHFTAEGFKAVRGKDKIPSMFWNPSESALTPSAPKASATLHINEQCPIIGELQIVEYPSLGVSISATAAERSATAAKTTFADNSPARVHAVADFARTLYDEATLEPITDVVTLSADWTVYAFDGPEQWRDAGETRWVETANTTTGTPHQVRWVRASPPLPTGPIPWTGGVFHYGWEHVVTAYAVDKLQKKQVSDRGRERWVDADPAQTRQGRMIGPVVEGRFSGSFSARENSKGDQGPYTIFPGCDDGCEEIKVYQSAPSPGMHPSPDPPNGDGGGGFGGGGGGWSPAEDEEGEEGDGEEGDGSDGGEGSGGSGEPPPSNGDGESCPHGHAFKAVPPNITVPREAKHYRVKLDDAAAHDGLASVGSSGCVKKVSPDGTFTVAFTDAGDDSGGYAFWGCVDGCTASCTVSVETGEEDDDPEEPDEPGGGEEPEEPDEPGTGGGGGGGSTAPISPTADAFTLADGAATLSLTTTAAASRLSVNVATNAARIFLETSGGDFASAAIPDESLSGTAGEPRTFPLEIRIAKNATDSMRTATLRLRIAEAGFAAARTVEAAVFIAQAAAGATALPDDPEEPDEPGGGEEEPDEPGTGGGEEEPDEPGTGGGEDPSPPTAPRLIATPESLAFPAGGGEAELTLEVLPADGADIASARLFIPAAAADVFRAELAEADAATGAARFRIRCSDAGTRFAPARECVFVASAGEAESALIPARRAAGDAAAFRGAARTFLGGERCSVFIGGKRAAFFVK